MTDLDSRMAALLDGAHHDWSTSGDAMRWTPGGGPQPERQVWGGPQDVRSRWTPPDPAEPDGWTPVGVIREGWPRG